MEEKDYNKIASLFQFLKYSVHSFSYRYEALSGPYKAYQLNDAEMPKDTMRVIEKLTRIKAKEVYEKHWLESKSSHEKYYDFFLIKSSDKEIGFHYDLGTILFNYLLEQLKEGCEGLLKTLKSDQLITRFASFVERSNGLLTYNSTMHHEIFKYLKGIISDYEILHFHLMNLSDCISHDGYSFCYDIEKIENALNSTEDFNFKGINLISQ